MYEGARIVPWSKPIEYLCADVQQESDGRAVIRFAGDFDLVSQRLAYRTIGQVLPGPRQLVLDLSRVTFFDAAGVRFLLAVQRRSAAASCDVRLRHPSRAVRRVLVLTDAAHLVPLEHAPGAIPAAALTRHALTVCNSAVEAALTASGADMGSVHLRDPVTGALHIVAERGFGRPFLAFFETVHDGDSACGAAMLAGRPVWVPDVATSAIYRDTPALEVMRAAGSRAVASVPALSAGGSVVAVVSAHCRRPTAWSGEQCERLAGVAATAAQLLARPVSPSPGASG